MLGKIFLCFILCLQYCTWAVTVISCYLFEVTNPIFNLVHLNLYPFYLLKFRYFLIQPSWARVQLSWKYFIILSGIVSTDVAHRPTSVTENFSSTVLPSRSSIEVHSFVTSRLSSATEETGQHIVFVIMVPIKLVFLRLRQITHYTSLLDSYSVSGRNWW